MCLMPQLNLKENLDILSKDIQLCEKLFIEAFNRKFKKSLYTTIENENATTSFREVDANTSPCSSRMPSVLKSKSALLSEETPDTKEINVFENGDGSLKVIVERNSCTLQHRRPQSANNLYELSECSEQAEKHTIPSQRCEKGDNLKSNKLLKENEMSEKRAQQLRPKSRSSSPKRSWGELLEKQSIRSHSKTARHENQKTQQSVKTGSAFPKKQEYKTQLPNNLKSVSAKGNNVRQAIGKASHLNSDNSNVLVHNLMQSKKLSSTKAATEVEYKKKLPIVAEQSSRSSEFASSVRTRSSTIYTSDNPDNIDRSVQCLLINGKCTAEEGKTQQHGSTDNFHVGSGGAFAMFNPVRTLNFLIKELQGITQKGAADSKINRIIADMEQTLRRIPPEIDSDDFRRHTDGGHIYCQHARCGVPPIPLPSDLQYELKLTIERMEKTSQQMQATCDKLREQRDKLQVALKEKEAELDDIKRQEETHEETLLRLETDLATVSHKAEEYCNTISELSEVIFKLKKENNELIGYRDAHNKTVQLLHASEQKTEQLNTQLQLAEISREKLNAQLEARDMELKSCKEQVADMKSLILQQLKSLKSSVRLGGSSNSSSEKGDSALPSARLLCSSPTSSANSSLLGISPSWQKISSIPLTTPATSAGVMLATYEEAESQEFITLGANANPSTSINLSSFAFKSLEGDSGVGNEVATPSQILDGVASVEKVDSLPVKQTESDSCLGNEFQLLFNRLKSKTLQLGSDIILPEPPRPYEALVPEPAGLSQVSAVTDTDLSLNCAALSDPDTTLEAEDSKSKEMVSVIDRFLPPNMS